MINRVKKDDLKELFCEIHNYAGRIPIENDNDFGSLKLENTADETTDKELKIEIYEHAYFRAKWCAASATSGCEGISRSENVNRIKIKIDRLQ